MINISLCFDNNYREMALAVMRSVIEQSSSSTIKFYLLVDMDDSAYQGLVTTLQAEEINAHAHQLDTSRYSNLTTKGHITRAAFMRLEIAHVFPDLERVLYLDSDLVVVSDIASLWDAGTNGKPLSAVSNAGKDGTKRLGLNESHVYFNSGVMLMDLNYFRLNNIRDRAYSWLEENNKERAFHDQDALNVLYENQCHPLPLRYNLQAFFYRFYFQLPNSVRTEFKQEHQNSVIIHFSSGRKPWQEGDKHPFRDEFLKHFKGKKQKMSSSVKESFKLLFLSILYFRIKRTLER